MVAVRSPELRAAMRDIQAGWPIQRRRAYAGKLPKMAGLAIFNDPRRFAVLHRLLTRSGVDLDTMINTSTRSFAHGEALLGQDPAPPVGRAAGPVDPPADQVRPDPGGGAGQGR